MDYNCLLLRYGEIFLKLGNRSFFEGKLTQNIRFQTKVKVIKKLQGRLILPYFKEHSSLQYVFGLTSYSPCLRVDKDLKQIKEAALEFMRDKVGSFMVKTARSDKRFPQTSPEVSKIIGMSIEKAYPLLTFSLNQPPTILNIEINQEGAYLFLESYPCYGGLPTGVEGKAAVLIKNKADLLAGLLMMKRGVTIYLLIFNGKMDLSLLQHYSPSPPIRLNVGPFFDIQKYLFENKIELVVTGENFESLSFKEATYTILKPLISYSALEIDQQLEKYSQFPMYLE